MYGAIIGDIVGSQFDIEANKTVYFKTFGKLSRITDETIVISAVSKMLNDINPKDLSFLDNKELYIKKQIEISNELRMYCAYQFKIGFGSVLQQWILSGINRPYNSSGNAGIIRVIPIPFYCVKNNISKENMLKIGKMFVTITHIGEEIVKQIDAYMTIMYELLINKNATPQEKKEIIKEVVNIYELDIKKIEEYRFMDGYNITAKHTLEVAIAATLEDINFINTLHLAVSVGGGSGANTCLAGSLAEQVYGVSNELKEKVKKHYFPLQLLYVLTDVKNLLRKNTVEV